MKVIVFAKEKPGLNNALNFLKLHTNNLIVYKGENGDPFPIDSIKENPDITISYISPWIIPGEILENTKKWSINFHPGPPEYPGIGCTNFAIYNEEKKFGVTAHLMNPKVDSGKIINVKRFSLLKNDSVFTLTNRCYDYILIQFYEVISYIFYNNEIPKCNEIWKRKPYTRKQLNDLCKIRPDMEKKEVKRRIKALSYPGMPGAYVKIFNYKFEYENLNEF